MLNNGTTGIEEEAAELEEVHAPAAGTLEAAESRSSPLIPSPTPSKRSSCLLRCGCGRRRPSRLPPEGGQDGHQDDELTFEKAGRPVSCSGGGGAAEEDESSNGFFGESSPSGDFSWPADAPPNLAVTDVVVPPVIFAARRQRGGHASSALDVAGKRVWEMTSSARPPSSGSSSSSMLRLALAQLGI